MRAALNFAWPYHEPTGWPAQLGACMRMQCGSQAWLIVLMTEIDAARFRKAPRPYLWQCTGFGKLGSQFFPFLLPRGLRGKAIMNSALIPM